MDNNSIDNLINSLEQQYVNIRSTPSEIGCAIKRFNKNLQKFFQLTEQQQAEFLIQALTAPENKEAVESFIRRHS